MRQARPRTATCRRSSAPGSRPSLPARTTVSARTATCRAPRGALESDRPAQHGAAGPRSRGRPEAPARKASDGAHSRRRAARRRRGRRGRRLAEVAARARQSSRMPAPPATRTTSLTDSTTRSAVRQPRLVHHHVQRARHLLADRRVRQAHPGHQRQRLDPPQRVRGRVRVHGRQRAVVAGVQRLEHVERLRAAHLADHDPVGPHPQRVHARAAGSSPRRGPRRSRAATRAAPHAAAAAAARPRPRSSRSAPRPGSRPTARRAWWSSPSPSRRSPARPPAPATHSASSSATSPGSVPSSTSSRSE